MMTMNNPIVSASTCLECIKFYATQADEAIGRKTSQHSAEQVAIDILEFAASKIGAELIELAKIRVKLAHIAKDNA
jgi:hypothetical protein